jgi:DNA-binding transcriptional MerR regulator
MDLRSTRDVARLLGIGVSRLARAVWEGRIDPPAKGPGGAYLWTRRDIERASWALRHRSADDVLPPEGGAQ